MALTSYRPDLGVAVVGVGRWGRNVLSDFQDIAGVRVRALCDVEHQRLFEAPTNAPEVELLTSFSQVLDHPGVEAIALCTPAQTHFDLARQALARGRHVFVEKPLCLSSKQAHALVIAAKQNSRVLVVGHQMLYHWGVQWLRTVLGLGLIGEPLRFSATRHNQGEVREDVGPWWSLAPHDVSILRYLFPRAVLQVELTDTAPVDIVESGDWARAVVRLEGGLSASISVASGCTTRARRLTVEGSAGVAVFDESIAAGQVELYRRDARGVLRTEPPCGAKKLQGFRPLLTGAEASELPLRLECQDFVRCIQEGGVSRNSGSSALAVVEVLEAGAKALDERNEALLSHRGSDRDHPIRC